MSPPRSEVLQEEARDARLRLAHLACVDGRTGEDAVAEADRLTGEMIGLAERRRELEQRRGLLATFRVKEAAQAVTRASPELRALLEARAPVRERYASIERALVKLRSRGIDLAPREDTAGMAMRRSRPIGMKHFWPC